MSVKRDCLEDVEESLEEEREAEVNETGNESKGELIWLIIMSCGFTLLFTAFQTGSQVAEIVFKSYKGN